MTIASAASLIELLRQYHLVEAERHAELERLQVDHPDPRSLARELVRRGWLTPFQINQLFQGRAESLVLGSYVLLDRLGEGGMGTVFKALHRKMGRIVALKALRSERVSNADAIRRFHREIQAAARLVHPNIVLAYDAGEACNVHFFTMEHIEGRDLARLVREEGPLDAARACDYVRQAALGLQHAHEQGMVHRDIKPHNLLLSNTGVVKVLDMGLARLASAAEAASVTASLTQEGAVMGTPDFMAPEQSLSTHTVDIRADLYGLGCTLYFLLTGKVPFPGGTLGDKIARHLAVEPRPLEQLRPAVPLCVAAVVRKMMAKKPEERYSTPAEVADALTHALVSGSDLAVEAPMGETEFDLTAAAGSPARSTAASAPSSKRRWLWAIGTALCVLSAGSLMWVVLAPGRSPKTATTREGPSAAAKNPRKILIGHTAPVRCLAFSPDGGKLASGDNQGIVRIWKMPDGEALVDRKRHPHAVRALVFAFDGTLASGSEDGRIVFWDAATFAEERFVTLANNGAVRGLSFLPADRTLAAISADKTLTLWDPATGIQTGGRFFPDDAAEPCSLAFAPDRDYWWAIGLIDGRTLLWNHEVKDQHELKGHTKPVRAVAFSRDGKLLATGGEDGCLKLWDVQSGEERGTLAENLGPIASVAISSDGRLLAAVGADSILRLWDLGSHRSRSQLRLEVGELRGVAFSPDNKTLAVCGDDHKVRLWTLADLLKPESR
ncbi:MAG: WD40 repeat domain-containing serine/threonine protein kinase [Gemmataceae bacterium]